MGNRPHICVSVVKGYFAGLNNVGMPLALCVQLQEHELMFSTAQWTMRQSHAGLSILLFWPTSSVKPVPKKWRRRRRKQPAQLHADPRGCSITEKPQVWDERWYTWLAFSRDGSQGWTPVVHRKKKRQIWKMTPTRSTKAESSEEEFGPTNRNVKWTPVIPSPVSYQTGSQTRE